MAEVQQHAQINGSDCEGWACARHRDRGALRDWPAQPLSVRTLVVAAGAGETGLDVTARLDRGSFGKLLRGRSQVSTLGKLCDIASWFCLAAAVISWIVLR